MARMPQCHIGAHIHTGVSGFFIFQKIYLIKYVRMIVQEEEVHVEDRRMDAKY